MGILLLLLGLVLFIGLVVIHEFGHFVMARRNGVEVEEFGIGFPPAIWRKRIKSDKGDYDFTINALPLGGFVKLKGEHDIDETPGTFGAASLSTKVKVMVAGVVMNLVAAFFLLTLVALIGMPKLLTQEVIGEDQFTVASDTRVTQRDIIARGLEPDSPATKAGLQERDRLISIGPVDGEKQPIEQSSNLPELTRQFAGQEVEIQYTRGGELRTSEPTQLRSQEEVQASRDAGEPKGYLGLVPVQFEVRQSTWSAPIVATGVAAQITKLTFQVLGTSVASLFRGDTAKASEQVSGPVGIFFVLKEGSTLGIKFILMIIAIISLSLAIMNVLPIPALDGGRLFLTLFFRAIRKPLQPNVEDNINLAGFAFLMLLFVLITIVDVRRFF